MNRLLRLLRTALPCVAVVTLGACTSLRAPPEEHDDVDWPMEAPATPNGAIFQVGRDVPLWENSTARRVGDTVLIRLVERTDAQKSSTTSTSKATSVALPGPTIAGRPVTVNGTEILNMGMENESSFDGQGGSAQSNRLTGDITVTVVKRHPNGNLFVRGEKWVGINQGKEFVKVAGVIRPIDIEPDNSIASSKVANAKLSYGGSGSLADANSPGWLSRFFNSPVMPF